MSNYVKCQMIGTLKQWVSFNQTADSLGSPKNDPRSHTKPHEKGPVIRDASCDFVDRALTIETKASKMTHYRTLRLAHRSQRAEIPRFGWST